MTYDKETKTLTADEGKILVRKEDGAVYGESIALGYTWYIGGKKLDTPHEDVPDDFGEQEKPQEPAAESTTMTIDEAKGRKKAEIEAYDSSEAVNSFTVTAGGETFAAWMTNAERTSYTASVGNAELLGETAVDLLLDGRVLTLPTDRAKVMLAQISRYADKCWMVTQRHLMAVDALADEGEIGGYDYRQGYPERLEFEI